MSVYARMEKAKKPGDVREFELGCAVRAMRSLRSARGGGAAVAEDDEQGIERAHGLKGAASAVGGALSLRSQN